MVDSLEEPSSRAIELSRLDSSFMSKSAMAVSRASESRKKEEFLLVSDNFSMTKRYQELQNLRMRSAVVDGDVVAALRFERNCPSTWRFCYRLTLG